LVIDYSKIECDQEVSELLDSKRLLFKRQHQITVRGIPVDPGAEDINNPTKGMAWSLIRNQWVRGNEPTPSSEPYDRTELMRLLKIWHKIIGSAQRSNDLQILKQVLKLLKKYRKLALNTPEQEYSLANLVYKSLRNDQTINKLQQQIFDLTDQKLSLK
jgi:hypothetical protein